MTKVADFTPTQKANFAAAMEAAGFDGIVGLSTKRRLRAWADRFAGVGDVRVMSSPPTCTISSNTFSVVNGSINAAGIPTAGLYANLGYAGAQTYEADTGNSNNPALRALGPNNTTGGKTTANLLRVRFTMLNPDFEVCYVEATGSRINALVDGELIDAGTGVIPTPLQSGNVRYLRFNFGADVLSRAISSTDIAAGGSGYAVGDLVTLAGGTFTRPAKYRVKATTSGAVTVLGIDDPGEYTALPSWPASTTGGTGTGLTMASPFLTPLHTTLRPRKIELLIENARLYGVNYVPVGSGEASITPYFFLPNVPRLYWLGDSQDANTYGIYAGGQMGFFVGQRLGLGDNLVIDAMGGTGFNMPSGTAPAFEHANRINAVISAAPDIVFFPYSQNVGSNTQASSQAAALTFLNTLQAALPNTLFIMCGPAFGFQSWHLSAMQYVMANAADPTRIRMIDSITQGWANGSSSGFLTSDAVHWGHYGNRVWRSRLIAEGMANALLDMILNR